MEACNNCFGLVHHCPYGQHVVCFRDNKKFCNFAACRDHGDNRFRADDPTLSWRSDADLTDTGVTDNSSKSNKGNGMQANDALEEESVHHEEPQHAEPHHEEPHHRFHKRHHGGVSVNVNVEA